MLVLERRDIIGGTCVTEEIFPGFKFSTTSYLNSLLQQQVIDDLELVKHGYFVYPKSPAYFQPFLDGQHLFFWSKMEETQREIDGLRRLAHA